jgi:transposase-like protein
METDKKIQAKEDSEQKKKINEFIVDETQIKVGSHHIWLWAAIEPKHRQIIQVDISFEQNMLWCRAFVSHLIDKYAKHRIRQTWAQGISRPSGF